MVVVVVVMFRRCFIHVWVEVDCGLRRLIVTLVQQPVDAISFANDWNESFILGYARRRD